MPDIKPLIWPPYTQNLTKWQLFLRGTPFLCPFNNLKHDIRCQLKLRDATAMEAWSATPELLPTVNEVSKIITHWMYWPNSYFIPEDICGLLLYDGFDCSNTPIAIAALEKLFHIPYKNFPPNVDVRFEDFIRSLRRK